MNRNLAATIVAASLLAGCATTQPIANIANDRIEHARPLSPGQVRAAIVAAALSLGWRVKDAGLGRMEATLYRGAQVAVVDIPFSGTQYRIEFKDGENLDAGKGAIHRDYNEWVRDLDRAIRAAISRL